MIVTQWWKLSSDEIYQVMKVTQRWKLPSDESYLVMKVILWWKLPSDESCQVMKVTQGWKLPSDESYLVMKAKIVQEVKRSDGLWRFACGDVLELWGFRTLGFLDVGGFGCWIFQTLEFWEIRPGFRPQQPNPQDPKRQSPNKDLLGPTRNVKKLGP